MFKAHSVTQIAPGLSKWLFETVIVASVSHDDLNPDT